MALDRTATIFILISIFVGIAVALITLNWFFRDGDDSTRSLQDYVDNCLGPFSFTPWWLNKFGLWLGLSAGAGLLCYYLLPLGWQKVLSYF